MRNTLTNNLVALMESHAVGGVQLARVTGIPLSTIKNIKNGVNTNPTIETLVPLADYFDVSIDEFISEDLSTQERKLNQKYSKSNQFTLPVISWEEAVMWKGKGSSDFQIFTEKQCSEHSFALNCEQNISEHFTAPGLILIDPVLIPTHYDYVLVHKKGLAHAFVKQFLCDEENCYLKSIVIANNLVTIDQNYKLLGVVIEYRQSLKAIDIKKNKVKSNMNHERKKIIETFF